MELKGKKIGVAVTGSFCTYEKVFEQLEKLKETGAEIVTIFSDASQTIDSRFGAAEDFMKKAERITGAEPLRTISQAATLPMVMLIAETLSAMISECTSGS